MNKNLIALTIAGFALSACVTINIYFPAAATEKAADKIIDEVWQTQKPEQPKLEEPKNSEAKPVDNNMLKETK